jgi:hypothetical protein
MADNRKKTKQDGMLVSQQKHELKFLADKHDLPVPLISNVAKQVGPSRAKVDAKLAQMKRNGKKWN